jgi:TB2/DP1, HVA22 family
MTFAAAVAESVRRTGCGLHTVPHDTAVCWPDAVQSVHCACCSHEYGGSLHRRPFKAACMCTTIDSCRCAWAAGGVADPSAAVIHQDSLQGRVVSHSRPSLCMWLAAPHIPLWACHDCSSWPGHHFERPKVLSRLCSSIVGTIYPVYASLKAVEAPLAQHPRKDAQWLTYWAIYGSFSLLEYHASGPLNW